MQWSLTTSAGGEVGVGLKPGGHSGGMHLLDQKSSRALSVTCGTAKLQHCVVRALSSFSPCILFSSFFLFVRVQLSLFSPSTPTHPCLPPLNLPALALSICLLYMFLDDPSPIFPHYSSVPSFPLVTVSLFFISMSLVMICLLLCFVH